VCCLHITVWIWRHCFWRESKYCFVLYRMSKNWKHTENMSANASQRHCCQKKTGLWSVYASFCCCMQYLETCCLSNALHSSIGQNIKSHPCPLSGLRYPVSGVHSPARVWKTSNGHNSATRHSIDFVFGSRLGFLSRIALFNLTAYELHELYYDRPTS